MMRSRLAGFAVLHLVACYTGGDELVGLAETPPGDGPLITWDLDAKPLPEIPFPNDIATRPDETAGTGKRVNASLDAPTQIERDLRRHMATLDGFGTYAPLWARFDRRLDLIDLAARQRGDTHFDDDAVLLIDVTPNSPTYGQAQVLDFGNGSFPITLERTNVLFDKDPRSTNSNLLVETVDEDLDGDGLFDTFEDTNQNGALDPGEDRDGDGKLDLDEDTDADGVFDKPNVWSQVDPSLGDDPYDDLITFYELETDTLWFRPLAPLRERTTYAVVFTRDLRGEDGSPIRSPFPYVHHLQQTRALEPLRDDALLAKYGKSLDDIAFAWTFTTQSVTEVLHTVGKGLNGQGSLARLDTELPRDISYLAPMTSRDGNSAYLLTPTDIVAALDLIFARLDIGGFDKDRVDNLLESYGAVDYIVAGDYVSPDFLAGGNGIFDIDPHAGTGTYTATPLRFVLVVPKQAYGTAPFPVALYCHGYTSLKLEALAFAGVLAKFGIATFVIDAYNHGLPIGGALQPLIDSMLVELDAGGLRPFFTAIAKDRATDLNNDRIVDPGGDFWTNDTFHTRDIVRQTVIDYLAGLRVLQSFDGQRAFTMDVDANGALDDLAGDFNGDGFIDVGGPTNDYFAMGTSMGGLVSSILGTVDPGIKAAAPISPGGGLFEIGLRTSLGNVRTAVYMPLLGPMITTDILDGDPRYVDLVFMLGDVFEKKLIRFGRVGKRQGDQVVDELRPGDTVQVENLRNQATYTGRVTAEHALRLHIAADKHDPLRVTVRRPNGDVVKVFERFEFDVNFFQGDEYLRDSPLVALQGGLGLQRNTPGLRRLLGLAQVILEPGDPVNYVAASDKNLLMHITLGDSVVPAATGVALARAAGAIGYRSPDPRYGISQNQLLIDHHVIEAIDQRHYFADDACHYHPGSVNFDIDDLSDGQHPADLPRLAEVVPAPICEAPEPPGACATCEPLPPLRATVQTSTGYRAVRFPALAAGGQHAIDLPDPGLAFDPSMFVINQIGLFLQSRGTVLSDHPCLAKNDCSLCEGELGCPSLPAPPSLD